MNADIIEEITRIYGYDNFEINTTRSPLYPVREDVVKNNEDRIKDMLVKRYSLHEVHSYIWAYADEQKALGIPVEENVRLLNATNPNIETLRRSMGRVVDGVDENNLCKEYKKLAITLYSKTKDVRTLYFELRDMLATIADDLKHKALGYKIAQAKHSYEHPVNLNTVLLDGEEIGTIGIVHPTVGKKIDKKSSIVFAEIDMNAFAGVENASICYEEPSKFPPMDYDISVVVPAGVFYADLEHCWKNEGKGILKNTKIVDTYDTELFHSITIRFEFSSAERTLSSGEVQEIMDKIISNLREIKVTLR